MAVWLRGGGRGSRGRGWGTRSRLGDGQAGGLAQGCLPPPTPPPPRAGQGMGWGEYLFLNVMVSRSSLSSEVLELQKVNTSMGGKRPYPEVSGVFMSLSCIWGLSCR